jgi:hypothetical protein
MALPSSEMQLDVAVTQMKGFISFIRKYRETACKYETTAVIELEFSN